MTKHSGVIMLSCLALLGFLGVAEAAEKRSHPTGCYPTRMAICGVSLSVPGGFLGEVKTLDMPKRFQTSTVVLQCAERDEQAFYMVLDPGNQLCALKKCAPTEVTVCDRKIPVPLNLSVGEAGKVSVPREILSQPAPDQAFTARCEMEQDQPVYVVDDTASLTCPNFACEPTTLPVCGSSVTLDKPAAAGDTMHLRTPLGHPVTVRCLGSGHQAPHYVVTDHPC